MARIRAKFNTRELAILCDLMAELDSGTYEFIKNNEKNIPRNHTLKRALKEHYKEITDLKSKIDYLSNRLWERIGEKRRLKK